MTHIDELAMKISELILDGLKEHLRMDQLNISEKRSNKYVVSSDTTYDHYKVDMDALTCTCPDHFYRKRICKHIRRLQKKSNVYTVPSGTLSSRTYSVNLNTMTCTCPHHKYKKARCKHIRRLLRER